LNYLKRLPIGTLKIDRSFVGGLTTDADDASIGNAVIGMGQRLHMRVVAEGVAEGVEIPEQLAFVQGALLSRRTGLLFQPACDRRDVRPAAAAQCTAGAHGQWARQA
jgi:EAL domain-containing protein (putative c-di-GMP-specific phosphodiesterase class I)